MSHIYFTRHGETVWNVANKICGVTDVELTDKGRQQATQLGERIKSEEIKIDKILSSPLKRAKETARLISEACGVPMQIENRLIEQNFGKYESTPRDNPEFVIAKSHFVDSFSGGETMMKVAQRIYNLLDDLKNDDKVYLLVAHNGIARVANSYFYDMDNETYSRSGIKNCELIRYEY